MIERYYEFDVERFIKDIEDTRARKDGYTFDRKFKTSGTNGLEELHRFIELLDEELTADEKKIMDIIAKIQGRDLTAMVIRREFNCKKWRAYEMRKNAINHIKSIADREFK